MVKRLKALHNEIAEMEEDLKRRIVGPGKVLSNCDKIVTKLDEDSLRVTIFDGPAHVSTTMIEPGLIISYCGGVQLTQKRREQLVRELGL